ncbi:MAG: dTDP-4-dehydrorhamnose reductase [Bacteroidales bacterium]|nr:dTDP-4-dehydrorhamnose reductase [Bacteroidales bacterium]
MNYNILVTGSNGQLGSEIQNLSKLFPELDFTYTDINQLDILNSFDLEVFFKNKKFDYIVNCAAYTAVDKAESEPDIAEAINTTAVKNLIKFASQKNARFIHTSTDYVFDGKNHRPYTENDTPNPQSKYGITKLKGEAEALKYEQTMIIRTSWLYSSYGNNFVKTIRRLGNERDTLKVVYDQAGTPTYAKDLAKAIIHIISDTANNSRKFIPGIYHYSNEGICSWYDFAVEIISQSSIHCKIIPIESKDFPTPAKRPFYSVLNKSKIKETYELVIPYWKDSLIECLNIMNSQ